MGIRYFRNTSKDIIDEKDLSKNERVFLNLKDKVNLEGVIRHFRDKWDLPEEGIFDKRNQLVWLKEVYLYSDNALKFHIEILKLLNKAKLPEFFQTLAADYIVTNFRFNFFQPNDLNVFCHLEISPEEHRPVPYPSVTLTLYTATVKEIYAFIKQNQSVLKQELNERGMYDVASRTSDIKVLQRDSLIRSFKEFSLKDLNLMAKGSHSSKSEAIRTILGKRYGIDVDSTSIAKVTKASKKEV